jgi:excisionase family DNA binding protein
MPEGQPRPARPTPERLALGEASRFLGVDPDTLRRWADAGRVSVFTTPGGHRRFDRRALERLVSVRGSSRAGKLAGVGDSSTRLSAAYRRRYAELHGNGSDLRDLVPPAERAPFREGGQRLVDALVRHLDQTGPDRDQAEQDAMELTAGMGDRLARLGVSLEDGVSMFVAARRPFIAELTVVARRRGVDALRVGQLYEASSGLLDRLLLAFVAAHAGACEEDASRDPGGDTDSDVEAGPRLSVEVLGPGACRPGSPDDACGSGGELALDRAPGGVRR